VNANQTNRYVNRMQPQPPLSTVMQHRRSILYWGLQDETIIHVAAVKYSITVDHTSNMLLHSVCCMLLGHWEEAGISARGDKHLHIYFIQSWNCKLCGALKFKLPAARRTERPHKDMVGNTTMTQKLGRVCDAGARVAATVGGWSLTSRAQ